MMWCANVMVVKEKILQSEAAAEDRGFLLLLPVNVEQENLASPVNGSSWNNSRKPHTHALHFLF